MPAHHRIRRAMQHLLRHSLYGSAASRARYTVIGLGIKEMRVCFRQFFTWRRPVSSFLRAVRYGLLGLLRLCLGGNVRFSYGYTAEDRLIESLLKPLVTYNGFYVDVGCHEPRFASNTFLLYRRGWRGICLDANETLVRRHRRIRPRDRAACALVSDAAEPLRFVYFGNPGLSSVDPAHTEAMRVRGEPVRREAMRQPQTLTALLAAHGCPATFDLLTVDVEDHDLAVLRSLDFDRFRPRLVVAEAEDFDPCRPHAHPVFTHLTGRGYAFKGSLLTNLYFMRD